jgi:hypothetical protein
MRSTSSSEIWSSVRFVKLGGPRRLVRRDLLRVLDVPPFCM